MVFNPSQPRICLGRIKQTHSQPGRQTEMFIQLHRLSEVQVIDELLFAIGGFNGVTTINHVECFDASTDEW